jgi:hypothetical protein
VNARNKFLIVLAVILAAATTYYFVSTPRSSDLVMIGTVDSNQIIVSPQMQGRIAKLLVDEGTQVKQGDLIASRCGHDRQPAFAGLRDPGHQHGDARFDFEQRGKRPVEIAIGSRSAVAGRGHAATDRE